MKNKLKKFLLVLLSSILFILANPNFLIIKGLGFLAWIYYLPVLLLVRKSSIKENFLYGFLYGLLSYAGYSYWLLSSYKSAFFFVIFGYGLILALVFLLLKIAELLFPKNHFIIQWLILSTYEFLKTLGFLGLHYGVTSYTQYNYKTIIQICDLIGPFGLNILIILFSCLLYSFYEKNIQKRNLLYISDSKIESGISEFNKSEIKQKFTSLKASVLFVILWTICFVCILSYGIYKLNTKTESKYIKICAVQNNENPWENGINVYSENVRNLMKLTTETLELNPDVKIVVWPETAVVPSIVSNYQSKKDVKRYNLVSNLLNYMNNWDCNFVIGNGHETYEKGIKKYYNSALVFESKNNCIPPEPEIYSKIKLVPFSESFPLKQKFPGFYSFLVAHGSQMWEPGKGYRTFEVEDLVFSTPICFEDTFPETGRNMYKAGSRCFVNLSNDSWSKSKVCQKQHLAMAIFRSVENRVPTVRSTTSGTTCIINSKGKIVKQAEEFTEACVVGEVEVFDKNKKETFYTQTGDWIGFVTIIITSVLLLIKIFIGIIRKTGKRNG